MLRDSRNFSKFWQHAWWLILDFTRPRRVLVLAKNCLINVIVRAVFNWVSKVSSLWLCIASFCDWPAKLTPLFQPMRRKTKSIATCTRAFSRALRRLHVIDSNSDWRIALFRWSNGPFPNYLRPPFQSESRCSSFRMQINFHSHENEFNLRVNENWFAYERMST